MTGGRAAEWLQAGSFFEWTPPDGQRAPLRIFHAELGDPEAPAALLLHGFPTSSIDWYDVAGLLAAEHRVGMLDFPGFGFSDKPRDGGYSLQRDRGLVEHYAREILGAESVAVIAHDRGDSVALAFAERCSSPDAGFELRHLVLSNGNMFLPLSNLTGFQRLILDPASAPAVLEALTPEMLAAGMGLSTFTPARSPQDPEIVALAATFAHNDGIAVLHETIQYLVERSRNERGWLDALAASSVPTTLVWGLYDTVSPLRVAAHVWSAFLSEKPGVNEFWLLPSANHYLQNDQPREFVEVLNSAMSGASPEPGALGGGPGAPVFIDRSRSELPSAAEVLAQPASLEALQQDAARLEG
ncbi:MAG TPA: alpha/beta hydrolase [Solirubrobacteraceae bacterium]|nr:alpha/beta hydrolase [Solirubrobacteraceae bacterium]